MLSTREYTLGSLPFKCAFFETCNKNTHCIGLLTWFQKKFIDKSECYILHNLLHLCFSKTYQSYDLWSSDPLLKPDPRECPHRLISGRLPHRFDHQYSTRHSVYYLYRTLDLMCGLSGIFGLRSYTWKLLNQKCRHIRIIQWNISIKDDGCTT